MDRNDPKRELAPKPKRWRAIHVSNWLDLKRLRSKVRPEARAGLGGQMTPGRSGQSREEEEINP